MSATDSVSNIESVLVNVSLVQEVLPAHHRLHGTPDPVVRRRMTVEVGASRAALEQTDYGHPGRFNPPQVRVLSATLADREAQFKALIPVLADLMS